jgi:TolB protein
VSRDGYVLNIYVMSVDGRAIRPVVYGKGDCENPSWAPDGRHLVYSALRGDERRLYVIDVETGRDRALTTGSGDCYGPTWSTVPRQ